MRHRSEADYNPWWDAAERYPAVHIEWVDLSPAHAAWVPSEGVILVDEAINQSERRCALAHELAHIDTGDDPHVACWFASRQESGADRLAARRLIDVHRMAEVFTWTLDPREVAAELDVTVAVLAARWRWLAPYERGVLRRAEPRREAVA